MPSWVDCPWPPAEGDIVGLPEGACLIGGNCSQRQRLPAKSFCRTV